MVTEIHAVLLKIIKKKYDSKAKHLPNYFLRFSHTKHKEQTKGQHLYMNNTLFAITMKLLVPHQGDLEFSYKISKNKTKKKWQISRPCKRCYFLKAYFPMSSASYNIIIVLHLVAKIKATTLYTICLCRETCQDAAHLISKSILSNLF